MGSEQQPRRRGRASLARRVEELADREHLFACDSSALVMVSGGQDSVALVHVLGSGALRKTGPRSVHVLHVNHHLRGDESDADEALVTGISSRLGVGVTVAHRPIDKRGGNLQEKAREARRSAALEEASRLGCDRIALGHTADDQVETMLYRMGRYGGLAALAGMKPCDPPWVRPLLSCRREETARYCEQRGLEFALDRGNAYPGYVRTGIRERIVPAWEATVPGAVEAACRTAEVVWEMQGLAAGLVAEASRTVLAREHGAGVRAPGAELSAAALLALPAALRRLLLHEWLEACVKTAASRASVLAVERLLSVSGSAERSLGGGWRVRKEYDRVSLAVRSKHPRVELAPGQLTVPGRTEWGEAIVGAEIVDHFQAPDTAREAFVDAGALGRGHLGVRGPRAGDRMRPLGSPGTRKLQDLMVDSRIPASRRARWPLVVCGERIIWACGLVIAEEVKITRDTTRILRLSLEWREMADQDPGPGQGEGGVGISGMRK